MTGSPEPPKPEEAERRIVYRVRPGGRGKPRPRSPAELRDDLEAAYVELQEMDIRLNDRSARENLRRRADGQPSAVPPHPALPLRNWATVQGDPVGEEYDHVEDRLMAYERWLKGLKRYGLYDGPTDLTFVTHKPATSPDDATAGATSEGS